MAETKVVKKKAAPKATKAPKKAEAKDSNTFAVFATGGKQYLVKEGGKVYIEKILGDHKEGGRLVFTDVLLISNGSDLSVGTPFIKGASVTATIEKIGRQKKIEVIHYKQKSRYFKRYGHRQPFFQIKIESIKN